MRSNLLCGTVVGKTVRLQSGEIVLSSFQEFLGWLIKMSGLNLTQRLEIVFVVYDIACFQYHVFCMNMFSIFFCNRYISAFERWSHL